MVIMFKVIENKPLVIAVPEKSPLLIEDGFSYARSVITPLTRAIVKGPQQIIITIDADRPLFSEDRTQRTINGEFFAGLFQDLLIALRDEYAPQIRHLAERENIHLATGAFEPDAINAISDVFHKTWVTYDPVERAFWKKISFGLQKADGHILMAEIDPGRRFLNEMDLAENRTLYQWVYQVGRGLDAAFGHDLSIDAQNPASRFDHDTGVPSLSHS